MTNFIFPISFLQALVWMLHDNGATVTPTVEEAIDELQDYYPAE